MEFFVNSAFEFVEKTQSGLIFRRPKNSFISNEWSLFQDTDFIKQKLQTPVDDGSLSPIQSFFQLERYNGIQLIQKVHDNLAALSKVIRGITLITNEIQEYAKDLLKNEVSRVSIIESFNYRVYFLFSWHQYHKSFLSHYDFSRRCMNVKHHLRIIMDRLFFRSRPSFPMMKHRSNKINQSFTA